MDVLDLIILFAGLMAGAVISAGCLVGLIVWVSGGRRPRVTEVCPPTDKS
ncbi:MAG: hypothetical protein QG602_2164 [Verrucomicrobiota bacterium]|nr:hypothetical protein [Verrucomicrobiota bacterium]